MAIPCNPGTADHEHSGELAFSVLPLQRIRNQRMEYVRRACGEPVIVVGHVDRDYGRFPTSGIPIQNHMFRGSPFSSRLMIRQPSSVLWSVSTST